ncbi:MAG: hypothetical protein Fur0032_04030 [Terrimicrobiaceae bacterium]
MGLTFEEGFRADIIVEDRLLIELKSVENLLPVHSKQVLTYLRLLKLPLGLLINFGVPTFKDGCKRIVNRHTKTQSSLLRLNPQSHAKARRKRRWRFSMSSKSKPLRAFASSRETQKEETKPALVPKLRFPEFRGAALRSVQFGDVTEKGRSRNGKKHSVASVMPEIEKNDFNISRYISTAVGEEEIDLAANHGQLLEIERSIQGATKKHNEFLRELGLPMLPE